MNKEIINPGTDNPEDILKALENTARHYEDLAAKMHHASKEGKKPEYETLEIMLQVATWNIFSLLKLSRDLTCRLYPEKTIDYMQKQCTKNVSPETKKIIDDALAKFDRAIKKDLN